MMQAASDIMLGWGRVVAIDGETKDFYIRQLWDAKASAEIELMNAAELRAYGRVVRVDARPGARAFRGPGRDRRISRVG